jgi:hypothetical protein
LPRIAEIINLGVNSGATLCLKKYKFKNIKKRDAQPVKQGIPQGGKGAEN